MARILYGLFDGLYLGLPSHNNYFTILPRISTAYMVVFGRPYWTELA